MAPLTSLILRTRWMQMDLKGVRQELSWKTGGGATNALFWQNMYDKHKDDPGWVRIDGESWVLKPMVENVPSGWNSLGCGGRKMYINIEGKGIVTSNNCWCQGDVSDAFKDLMPDNATWATKEEFDKAPVVGYIVEGIGLVFTDREGHEVNA